MKQVRNSGYAEAGASFERRALRSFAPSSGSPKEDILASLPVLRRRSRLLYMSTPLATAALDTNRTHVIGPGLKMQSTPDLDVLGISEEEGRRWQQRAEAEFELWAGKAERCDALGLNTFYEMQALAFKAADMSGDVFALMKRERRTSRNPYSLRLHLIEADRICTPTAYGGALQSVTETEIPKDQPGAGNRVYDGVETDKNGRITAYHVASRYPDALVLNDKPMKWSRIPVRGERSGLPNILHIMSPERPEQYRGVPFLARVIESLLQLRRCTDSELMAALVRSFFTAWITTEQGGGDIPVNEVQADGPAEERRQATPAGPDEYRMGPGTVLHLKTGENVNFANPNIQTTGFDIFVKVFCRLIGASLEIPYDVLVKEFNSSYSASRGALMEAWEAFRMRRSWFISDFCQPVYELWLAEAVALGRIKAPGFFDDPLVRAAWCGAKWVGPISISLDPVKETKAGIAQMGAAIKTGQQVTQEMGGGDYDENITKRKAEVARLKDAGLLQQEDSDGGGDGETNEGGEGNA
ncbi:MAG: phage portal protein [Oscillospiraceae bacterium]|nr:phage portal protein [Oscillospiraceae bacterium]